MAKSLSKKPIPSKPSSKSVKTKVVSQPAKKPAVREAAKAVKATTKARTPAVPVKPVATAKQPVVLAKPVAPAKSSTVVAKRPAPAPPPVAIKAAAPAKRNHVSREPVEAPRPIQPSVPTNDKPRKNQAGMNSKDLEYFRDLLLAKRRELVGDVSAMEREALRSSGGTNLSTLPIHMADMGTDNYEQEFTLGLVEKDRNLLREINSALAKIQNGNYGICEATSKPIGRPRLEAQPWAKFSIEHARQLEKRVGR